MTSSDVRVTGLYVYPVKSCAGTSLQHATLGPRGIVHDREFMVVRPDHRFLTQRQLPRLALIRPTIIDSGLRLEAPGVSQLELAWTDTGPRHDVVIWRDTVVAADQGDTAADWLSTYLGTQVRLVRMPPETVRRVNPAFARRATDQVGFADGYPLLLISEESLEDLNARVDRPLPMNRFRPNVVVRGWRAPFGEDTWSEVCIGSIPFSLVKACARCAITTIDQRTAERGAEPLATLLSFRHVPRAVLFGQNMIHAAEGTLAIGDRVTLGK